jgi:hypothetical protein
MALQYTFCGILIMQGKKVYTEQLFKSIQLSDLVPEDNFYHRLKGILNLQWVYRETKKYYCSEGQQSIDPVVFLKGRWPGD